MNKPDRFSHLKGVIMCGLCTQYYRPSDASCNVFHHPATCCHYGDEIIPIEVINGLNTPQQPAQSNLYTEEEVLDAIKTAFFEGLTTKNKEKGHFDPKDYLPKR